MSTKIFVAAHKEFDVKLDSSVYCPIHVGAALHPEKDLGFIKDSDGDNISGKNANFCELTAVYWAWKNDRSDIKGLCHYRRYFGRYETDRSESNILTGGMIERFLDNHDIILPYPLKTNQANNKEAYYKKRIGKEGDFRILRDVINDMYPDYVNAFDYVMDQSYACYFNMMIARKDIFDAYAKWLFDILFEVEKRVDMTGYNQQQLRVFGYMSERLLNVWCVKNKLNVKFVPYCMLDGNYPKYYAIKKVASHIPGYEFLKNKKYFGKNSL